MPGEPRLTSLLEELATALDHDDRAVLTGDLQRFAEPARGTAGQLDLVLAPNSVDQARVMINWARTHRVRLIPQGANSGLVQASTPGPGDAAVVLSSERLLGEIAIDPVDRTAVVPAGVRLSALNDALRPHGLRLPIDLGADPSIGGMAATNTGGARMIRHGDMRSHVLGVEAVIADEDESVIDEISVLRKDNSGLALSQLLVGSGGSLGFITKVALAVEPVATSTACAWILPASDSAVIETLTVLESTCGPHLSAFEVLSSGAMRPALDNISGLRDPFANVSDELLVRSELRVLVEFETTGSIRCDESSDAEAHLGTAVSSLLDSGLALEAVVSPDDDAWRLRHSITEGLRRCGTVVGFDVSVPRSTLPAFRNVVREQVSAQFPQARVADFGHWGDGGVHCSVVLAAEDSLDRDGYDRLRNLVFGIVTREFGGSFSAEHGIGPINSDWWLKVRSPGSKRLTHAIKSACDPLGILGHPRMPY